MLQELDPFSSDLIIIIIMKKLALSLGFAALGSAFRLGILSDIHVGEGCPSPYNFEENCYSVQALKRAVNLINSNLSSSIDLIIITGDITGSAQLTQYQKANEILSALQVPWIPLIGNHDTWPYTAIDEAETPIGDAYFGQVFG
jgi:3',5'-cyclic AMP phosphodiesterase CpdA